MSVDIGLNQVYMEQETRGDAWRRWWLRVGRGWRMHSVAHRRCADARLKLGFERVPPRVWARHGALLTSVQTRRPKSRVQ